MAIKFVVCVRCQQLKQHCAHGLCRHCYNIGISHGKGGTCVKCGKSKEKLHALDMCHSCYNEKRREVDPSYEKGSHYSVGEIISCAQCHEQKPHWAKGMCQVCYAHHSYKQRASKPDWLVKEREKNKQAARTVKRKVFELFGNRCAHCGETDVRLLTLDHINGDGAEQRRKLGGRKGSFMKTYRRILSGELPKEDFQLLCWNGNSTKHIYGEPLCKPTK